MKKIINAYIGQFICLLLVLLLSSCDKDNPVATNVNSDVIKIFAPDEIHIYRCNREQSEMFNLELSNSEPFEWKIVKKPDWFYCYVDTLNEHKAYRFNCLGDSKIDSTVTLEGELEIEVANIGTKKIKIFYLNANEPILRVDTLLKLDERWTSYLKIENIGVSLVQWRLVSPDPNISFSNDSGFAMRYPWLSTSVEAITINVNWGKYAPGNYSRNVKLITYKDTINIKLTFEVGEIKKAVVPSIATIGNDDKEVSYYIVNTGNMPVNWSVAQSSLPIYITASPEQGKIAVGDSTKITVKVNRELLPQTNSEFYLGINIDSYQYDTYKTKIVILNYKEQKTALNCNIVAAVQNKNTDEILIVSKSPNKLILMDFAGNIKKTKDLDYIPEAVSNEMNGKIVVTNANKAHIYNINDLTQTNEFTTKYNFIAVAVTQKYIIGSGQISISDGVLMRIELNNMIETDITDRYYLKFEKFFYNSSNDNFYGLVSSGYIYGYNASKWIDLEEWSLGNADLKDNCWFVSNGFKIISPSGSVLTSSEYRGLDGIYSGNIGISQITSIAENTKYELLAVSSNDLRYDFDSKKVYLMDNNYYLSKGEINLPDYLLKDSEAPGYKIYHPVVRYSFINSDASKVMVLMTPEYRGYYNEIPIDNWTYYIANIK